jgi:hypothetical protein
VVRGSRSAFAGAEAQRDDLSLVIRQSVERGGELIPYLERRGSVEPSPARWSLRSKPLDGAALRYLPAPPVAHEVHRDRVQPGALRPLEPVEAGAMA